MTETRVVISMDSHVEFYVDTKSYLESRWHETFDSAAKAERARFEATRKWQPKLVDMPRMSGRTGATEYYTDARPLAQRLKDLDEDGVAGEFITVGFGARTTDPEFMHALTQAEIRWFADFFSPAAHRFRGAVVATLGLGMTAVVDEIEQAYEHGIRGVILAGNPRNVGIHQPGYNSRYYDPMWDALNEREMAIVFHPGWSRDKPLLEFSGSPQELGWEGLKFMVMSQECREALPPLLLGAVPQRYPRLRIGFVEASTGWIPPLLAQLDGIVKNIGESSVHFDLLPSEMWRRQCFASGPLEPQDIEDRYEVGVENLAWGSDYPHAEGTWPLSRRWLGYLFKDVPRHETDLMVSGNAARIFGFDLDELATTPAAAVPWPTAAEAARWHFDDAHADEGTMFRELVDS
jgi:predicted TIM-barrel fold metal-dependent hydrolase